MAARDSRRDCRIGSSLSLRERDLGVRVQSLLNPDAEVEDIPTLTPALSPRGRVVYAGCFRLMPMGVGGIGANHFFAFDLARIYRSAWRTIKSTKSGIACGNTCQPVGNSLPAIRRPSDRKSTRLN